MKKAIKEFILVNIGLFLVAFGIFYFLIPNNIAAGGVSGLAIVINHYLPQIPVGGLMMIMNMVLFIVGIIFIGRDFGLKTIYSSLALSGMILIFETFFPIAAPVTNDILLELFCGILLAGSGMGIVFLNNASTGGTDIIAKILNKFFHINIGKGLLMADFFIVLSAAFAFGLQTGLYALLAVIINGFVIDAVIEGLQTNKQVTIIASEVDAICRFIIDDLGRGATIYTAKGAYTNEDRQIITTIVDRKEFIRLRSFIKTTDHRAFLSVSKVHETLGEGFKSLIQ
jgi:uncharacterized membrane-anchored protein YitT (DUF2179 family)